MAVLDDPATRIAVEAERRVLALLEAGCSAPVGVHASWADGELRLDARVYRLDGSAWLSSSAAAVLPSGPHAAAVTAASAGAVEALAARVARDLLDAGAAELAGVGA